MPESTGTSPADGRAESDDLARILRSPHSVRAFRTMMWGYLFFLPLASSYLDVAGWLVLLLGLRSSDASWPGRPRLRALAVAGLIVAAARIAVLVTSAVSAGAFYAVLGSASLLLAAAFLWEVCRLIAGLGERAGSRVLPAQARLRRWAFVAYAALPLALVAVGPASPGQAAAFAVLGAYLIAGTIITTLAMALLSNAASLCRSAASLKPPETPAEPRPPVTG